MDRIKSRTEYESTSCAASIELCRLELLKQRLEIEIKFKKAEAEYNRQMAQLAIDSEQFGFDLAL